MINEFVDLVKLWRFARLELNALPAGFFIKIGKTVQHDKVVWWVMVPVVDEVNDKSED